MKLQYKDLSIDNTIHSKELRERAKRSPITDKRLCLLVLHNKKEVGYLAFDLWPSKDYIVIYELYIIPEYRRKGIGTIVMKKAEKIAAEFGNLSIHLRPEPLSRKISKEQLIEWYRKQGYSPLADNPDLFVKELRVK